MSDQWCCETCRQLALEVSPLCRCGAPKDWHTEDCHCGPDVTGEGIDMCLGCARIDTSHPGDKSVPF